ncbi:S-adenosyl-L-methionine-dependent methyltransferase [Paraphysoderma sedebokerense]|nr:S-adenosyl-L-methionine-dependent methyltransferase [Paraphysoderma sedebokerense]
MKNPKTWRSSTSIQNILVSIPKLIWAIEVDRFTWLVCKMNVMIHLLPLYTRWTELQRNSSSKKYRAHKMKLERLRLFCNDTLKLSVDLPWQDAWEREQIHLLRNPEKLKFDFVVTNPPYIIRKRGIVTAADPALYDLDVVSGKGVQAYSYFMWCGLNRLSERGQLCFVTASQWLNLEFAQGLRCWMWNNCHLEEFYQFEPYKMWKTIQTDALIFKCRRIPYSMDAESHSKQRTITFLRCVNRKSSLTDILNLYETFEKNKSYSTNLLRFKITRQNQSSPTNSWAFIMPSNSTIEEIEVLVQGLPGICDPSGSVKHWSRECPLIWHRGPNTNPVYALVVRTEFAIQHFGQEACERWGKPCFYWCNKGNNGKLKSKEVDFWQSRDIKRVAVKENSPAESYLPSTPIKYTLLMIDRADSMQIERENRIHPSSLYSYLQEAREMLQPKMSDRQLAYCGYKQCGATHKVKIITPINYGYFSVSQPRQRFFVDFDSVTVTNQCIYFTVKEATCLDPLYFLGFLNSSIFQLFMRERCRYDQQNRMRLFREKMAEIPYKAPSSAGAGFVVKVVESIIIIKKLLYRIDSFVPKECRILDCLRKGLICLDSTATSVIMDMLGMPVAKCVVEGINDCLYAVAVLLYCIDQYMYRLYGVNEELQLRLEKEMSLNMDQSVISRFPRVSLNDEIPYWGESALDTAGVAALNKDDLLNILDKRESKK